MVAKPRTARGDEIPRIVVPGGAETGAPKADVNQLLTTPAARRDEDGAAELTVIDARSARIQLTGGRRRWRVGVIVVAGVLLLLAILAALLRP